MQTQAKPGEGRQPNSTPIHTCRYCHFGPDHDGRGPLVPHEGDVFHANCITSQRLLKEALAKPWRSDQIRPRSITDESHNRNLFQEGYWDGVEGYDEHPLLPAVPTSEDAYQWGKWYGQHSRAKDQAVLQVKDMERVFQNYLDRIAKNKLWAWLTETETTGFFAICGVPA